jgi:hypothetical protein
LFIPLAAQVVLVVPLVVSISSEEFSGVESLGEAVTRLIQWHFLLRMTHRVFGSHFDFRTASSDIVHHPRL